MDEGLLAGPGVEFQGGAVGGDGVAAAAEGGTRSARLPAGRPSGSAGVVGEGVEDDQAGCWSFSHRDREGPGRLVHRGGLVGRWAQTAAMGAVAELVALHCQCGRTALYVVRLGCLVNVPVIVGACASNWVSGPRPTICSIGRSIEVVAARPRHRRWVAGDACRRDELPEAGLPGAARGADGVCSSRPGPNSPAVTGSRA